MQSECRLGIPQILKHMTIEAAIQRNRAQQTLCLSACHEDGPIRVRGPIAESVTDIRRLLGVEVSNEL